MQENELDWDNLDEALVQFDGVVVEEGIDVAEAEDDNCAGGACKI